MKTKEKTQIRDRLIGSIERGPDQEIRVILQQYEDREFLNIRTFVRDKTGEFIPTKKGIMLDTESFHEFEDLIHKTSEKLA